MRLAVVAGLMLFPALVACGEPPAEKTESLGRQASAVQGGEADTIEAHNFAVGIASRAGAVCSGTLIAPNLVLTARHCVVPPDGRDEVSCKDSFGKNAPASTLFVSTEPHLRGAKKFYSVKTITTPADESFCGNDIALIELDANIPANEARPATPVVQFSMSDRTKVRGQVAAMGYGLTSPDANDSGTRRIREDIEIVCVPGDSSYACKGSYKSMLDSEREFITEGYVCAGDSGGGAFDQASLASGTPYVLGALSRGPQTESKCLAAVYSRTDAHAEMILAAGKKAAADGGYEQPAWLAPANDAVPSPGTTECEGDICTATDATEPAAIKRTSDGCSTASGSSKSSFGLVAFALAALVVLRRRRH